MNSDLIIKLGVVFYLCSILGYFYELILTYLKTQKVFSHGILKGPWLPIYGSGALLMLILKNLKNHPLEVFFFAFFLSGALEGLCGYILLKIFKMRLWDYTSYILNIDGLVCFMSAFCFALGGLLLIYVIEPLVKKLLAKINKEKMQKGLSLLSLFFLSDIIASSLN